jgi:DNA invertase Pin-like site-specific DNA recombinase
MKKRVRVLLRVSTKKQLNQGEMPLQWDEVMKEFEKHRDEWDLDDVNYQEPAVSGFKKPTTERPELMKIRADAQARQFDILLVFALDRLGRTGIDSVHYIWLLNQEGVEVYSIYERGFADTRTVAGQIMTTASTAQGEEESRKTSVRVDEASKVTVQRNNRWRGGTVPFGYKLELNGQLNSKRVALCDLVIHDEEAKIVRLIFDLCVSKNWGSRRIAAYLNEHGITNRGKFWYYGTIDYMLHGLIYKGIQQYGKTSCKKGSRVRQDPSEWTIAENPNPAWIIIDEQTWNAAQQIRIKNNTKIHTRQGMMETLPPRQGVLLFSGITFCGHCGNRMISHHHIRQWKTKDGTLKKRPHVEYMCSSKNMGMDCPGHMVYAQDKIENAVLEKVYSYLDSLKDGDLDAYMSDLQIKQQDNTGKELKKMKELLAKKQRGIDVLKAEIPNALLGESLFTKEDLSGQIQKTEHELDDLVQTIKQYEEQLQAEAYETRAVKILRSTLPNWRQLFEQSDIDEKKVMLAMIIDRIVVYKDQIDVFMRLKLDQLMGANSNELSTWPSLCSRARMSPAWS